MFVIFFSSYISYRTEPCLYLATFNHSFT